MFNSNFKKNGKGTGFIQIILVVVGALVLLKYVYDIDVVGFLTAGRFKEILDQFYSLADKGWQKYSDTIIKVWDYFVTFIKKLTPKLSRLACASGGKIFFIFSFFLFYIKNYY